MTDENPTEDAPAKPRRVTRWDRPKPPKDWRYFVGGIGRVLIATGVLLFLFVGYQLWGTGIEEAQSQRRLENEFESLMAELGSTVPPTTSAPDAVPPTTLPPDTLAPTTVPGDTPPPETAPPETQPSVTDPPGPAAVEQVLPPIKPGDSIGIINMPTIGIEKYIVAGVATEDLKRGPGHFANTPLPGQLGNSGIAGHRTTYGAPFYRVDELAPGDPIIVTTPFGTYTYRVTSQSIVSAADGWVLNTLDPTKATLTLVSCHPRYTAQQRLIVFADLDEAASPAVGKPLIQYGADPSPASAQPAQPLPGEPLPGEEASEVTTTEPASEPVSNILATTRPDDESAVEVQLVAVAFSSPPPDPPPADAEALQDELDEAFGRGWFSDDDAWPQVALWGFVLILISVGATMISRWARRNWVGALVGIGPFTVALYFWFQNVNRLLPPGF